MNAIRQFCKYSIAGGIGACIDFGLYFLIISISSLNYFYANVVSFSIGTVFVYFLQKNWTFQYQSDKKAHAFTKFVVVVIGTYFFNTLILILCVEFLHMNPLVSKGIQILISFIWGYSVNKMFVFKN